MKAYWKFILWLFPWEMILKTKWARAWRKLTDILVFSVLSQQLSWLTQLKGSGRKGHLLLLFSSVICRWSCATWAIDAWGLMLLERVLTQIVKSPFPLFQWGLRRLLSHALSASGKKISSWPCLVFPIFKIGLSLALF